ncbi:MAG: right-handed parallel beta-helix repeat-containing protein [Myxococcales bacterium]|nr:right-handed parallel beta-helix repeat-containing protein [Myxococcales bacterium]
MRAVLLASLLGLLLAPHLAGCMKTSEKYCATHDDPAHCPPGDGSGGSCQIDDDCTAAAMPLCDPASHTCVGCVTSADCQNPLPVCGADHVCGACRAHTDCASLACAPDGTCADEASVAYVSDVNAGGTDCTRALPCATVDEGHKRNRTYIKVTGTIVDTKTTVLDTDATILADHGAALRRTGSGPVIEIKASAKVAIYDLEIAQGTGGGSHGISVPSGTPTIELHRVLLANNAGYGISALAGSVVMSQSVIVSNATGGVFLSATNFRLTNNLVVQNGAAATSQTGGLTLSPGPQTSVFEFNTVADNLSMPVAAPARGLNCTLAIAVANNLFINNKVGPSCTVSYSMYETGTVVTGTNLAGDPMFRNQAIGSFRAADYYRISSTSAAKDQADPAATLTTDIDGNARPQAGRSDIGADEFTP